MSHINYAFEQADNSFPHDKMKLRNVASTRYSGDWLSIPHSHSYAELFYIVGGEGQFQINDKLFPVHQHQLVIVNANVIHTEVSLESHPLEYIVVGIEGLEFTASEIAEGSYCVYTFRENNEWDKTCCHCSKDNCRNGDDRLCCCHCHFAATSGFFESLRSAVKHTMMKIMDGTMKLLLPKIRRQTAEQISPTRAGR